MSDGRVTVAESRVPHAVSGSANVIGHLPLVEVEVVSVAGEPSGKLTGITPEGRP
jgi:hypothetical protein